MRKNLLFAFGFILGFAILAVVAFLLWLFTVELYTLIKSSNPAVAAAIIGAMATALVSIVGILLNQSHARRREAEESHRPRKVEIYKQFLEIVSRVVTQNNANVALEPLGEQELVNFLVVHKTNLILWGSPKVINAQLAFEQASKNNGNGILIAADKLFLAIRADLGLTNDGLSKKQLIKLYLKDPDELDK